MIKQGRKEIMNNICEWRESSVFPKHYLVSDDGRVKSIRTGKILKPGTDKCGYLYYVLCVKGKRHTVKAHRLVAMAFIDNPQNKPSIDHLNGNRTDNRASNLRWVTNAENSNNPITLRKLRANARKNLIKMYEASQTRDFGRQRTFVYKDGELIGTFKSQKAASNFTGVSPGKVSQCVAGKKKSCKGFVFRRKDKYIDHEANFKTRTNQPHIR